MFVSAKDKSGTVVPIELHDDPESLEAVGFHDIEEITEAEYNALKDAAPADREAARIANLEVPRYAALLALLGAGITEANITEQLALIANATDRETRRLYFNRPTWRRTSDFITWGKTAFALTDAQVDALFVAADQID